ncbi:adaptor protein MecA [Vallitalea sp.]|jgi:adapter protein MecA 1/2|uniref:adaptor protein MecA n=1 Tax=Vallitalea sp. TaxID=1882829 RepID=UPI0025D4CA9B|nr:adaptor protein MecA [Vallitalea sp.]MCT4687619.1 adaptor protein MecA [Vallitalea sp.]
MKIEKISNAQIRCTLNKTDLTKRQIKISELAYGTEKTQELFKDMMTQASVEFGFEADNVPLMIEAIPLSKESIMLIITKVDNPEELDDKLASIPQHNIRNFKKKEVADNNDQTVNKEINQNTKQIIYSFKSLDEVIKVAQIISPLYDGLNSLYKDETINEYYLVIHKSDNENHAFIGLNGFLSEYGNKVPSTNIMEIFYEEHHEIIIKNNAIQILSNL